MLVHNSLVISLDLVKIFGLRTSVNEIAVEFWFYETSN